MKDLIKEEEFEGRKLFIYLPKHYSDSNLKYPVVYIQDGDELINFKKEFFENLEENNIEFIGVMVVPQNRLDEYTPWYSKALNDKHPDFLGKGDDYLDFITNKVKPYIDKKYNTKQETKHTSIMGGSLGGLIALYGLYTHPEVFGNVISASGSFWYKNILSFLDKTTIDLKDKKIFMSIGENEDKHKLSPEVSMLDSNLKVFEILKNKGLGENLHFKLDEHSKHSMICFIPNFIEGLKWILDVNI